MALFVALPVAAEPTPQSSASTHMTRMTTLVGEVSALAKEKIKLDQLARQILPHFEQLRREGQPRDWELCASSIESAMNQTHDHLEFLGDLAGLNSGMQTPDDERSASDMVSLYAQSSANAVQLLGIWLGPTGAACGNDEDFTALRAWIAEVGPVLAGVQQTADVMRK